MLTVSGLTKRFGGKVAVDNLSFEVRPGRVTGFLGPNGSGKSTSLRCILALDRPDAGHATFDGRPYASMRNPLFEVGALLDAGYVHPGRTGLNHLRVIAASNGIATQRCHETLSLVGLTEVADRRIGGYSLGMRQRLGLAAVLLGDPKTVILDEPANGLDPEGIRWIRDVLLYLAGQGKTVLVSSHLLSEMAQMADDLIVIGMGRLIETGSVDQFIKRHAQRWVRVSGPRIGGLVDTLRRQGAQITDIDGTTVDAYGVESSVIGELAATQSVILHELSPQQGSLEDAFLHATAQTQEYRGVDFGGAPPPPIAHQVPPAPPPPILGQLPPPAPGSHNGGGL